MSSERQRIEKVYRSREVRGWDSRYSLFEKGALQMVQERERVLLSMLKQTTGPLTDAKRVLDIGCGTGGTLLPFVSYGVEVENCFGVDIQERRIEKARKRLPGMTFACCSAEKIPFTKSSFDLVTLFTCLSSVLDGGARKRICREALEMTRPGSWVLIYDFRMNNPFNADVRAVTLRELKECFSGCKYRSKTLTLAPPLGRTIGAYSMTVCALLAAIPILRTHRMTMFQRANR